MHRYVVLLRYDGLLIYVLKTIVIYVGNKSQGIHYQNQKK